MITCPRCETEMEYRAASALWLAHLECPECWLTFHYVIERIRRGKYTRYLAQGRISRAGSVAA